MVRKTLLQTFPAFAGQLHPKFSSLFILATGSEGRTSAGFAPDFFLSELPATDRGLLVLNFFALHCWREICQGWNERANARKARSDKSKVVRSLICRGEKRRESGVKLA